MNKVEIKNKLSYLINEIHLLMIKTANLAEEEIKEINKNPNIKRKR